MANPFFSGRIPAGLAEKIDAHLLVTGETRSELLVRLLRTEVGDNINDNKPDNIIADLLARVEKLEQLINNKADNKIKPIIDNVVDNKPSLALTQKELATRLGCSTSTLSRAAKADEDKWVAMTIKYPDPDGYQWRLMEVDKKLVYVNITVQTRD
jgi:hypothetical protein